jgi:hypothetical protein
MWSKDRNPGLRIYHLPKILWDLERAGAVAADNLSTRIRRLYVRGALHAWLALQHALHPHLSD